jgi:hypothetical protein
VAPAGGGRMNMVQIIYMYVNAKMIPVVTSLGILEGGGMKEQWKG